MKPSHKNNQSYVNKRTHTLRHRHEDSVRNQRIAVTKLELPNCPQGSCRARTGKSPSREQVSGCSPSALTDCDGPDLPHPGPPRLTARRPQPWPASSSRSGTLRGVWLPGPPGSVLGSPVAAACPRQGAAARLLPSLAKGAPGTEQPFLRPLLIAGCYRAACDHTRVCKMATAAPPSSLFNSSRFLFFKWLILKIIKPRAESEWTAEVPGGSCQRRHRREGRIGPLWQQLHLGSSRCPRCSTEGPDGPRSWGRGRCGGCAAAPEQRWARPARRRARTLPPATAAGTGGAGAARGRSPPLRPAPPRVGRAHPRAAPRGAAVARSCRCLRCWRAPPQPRTAGPGRAILRRSRGAAADVGLPPPRLPAGPALPR